MGSKNYRLKSGFLGILLSLIVLASSITFVSFSKPIYMLEYRRTGVLDTLGKSTVEPITDDLIGYLSCKNETLGDYFDANEKAHLSDVKKLFKQLCIIQFSLTILFLSCFILCIGKNDILDRISSTLISAGIISLIVVLLAFISFLSFGFDKLFSLFHRLLFEGNYSFDPRVSLMKAMLPDQLFLEMGILIIASYLVISVLILAFGIYIRRQAKSKLKKNLSKEISKQSALISGN